VKQQRPALTLDNVPAYLDWALTHQGTMRRGELEHHLTAAELIVRLKMGEAQNKATQHTLVEQGIVEPPPTPHPAG
jgi:hypothetical protein